MNKLQKILIAIAAAVELVFYLVSPILLCSLWIKFWNMDGFISGLFYSIGFISTAFRGYKIGWLNNE